MKNYLIILLIWNIIVMLVYGVDKIQAKRRGRRISERMLLLCSFLFGGYGAVFGMILFNHKTSKMKFRLFIPITVVVGVIINYFVIKRFYL